MRTNTQHAVTSHDRGHRPDDLSGPEAGVGRRTLRGVAVCGFAIAFAFAGQSVAQADDHRSRSGDGQWNRSSSSADARNAAAPAPAPAAAPAPAPAPAPAAAPAPAPAAASLTGKPTPSSTDYSAWAPHVRPVVAEVTQQFGVPTVYTRPGHSPTQQLAADFMVGSNRAMGDAVAQYVIDNAAGFKVEYVIWQQRIYMIGGSGWSAMEDRGSATANHMDHVHVSFKP
jgi:hypothetical protein